MKSLFAVGISALMLVGFSPNAVAISDCDKQLIVDQIERYKRETERKDKFMLWAALAEAPNGCWAYWIADSKNKAVKTAKKFCRSGPPTRYHPSYFCNQTQSCEIVLTGRLYPHNNYLSDKTYLRDRDPCDCSAVVSNTTATQTLIGNLSDTANITQGNINSLAGIGNDTSVIRFDVLPQSGKWNQQGRNRFTDGDEQIHVKYVGEAKNGIPHGSGRACYKGRRVYTGNWDNGVADGRGVMVTRVFQKVEGQFKDGVPDGRVSLKWLYGRAFDAQFKDGKREAPVKVILPTSIKKPILIAGVIHGIEDEARGQAEASLLEISIQVGSSEDKGQATEQVVNVFSVNP